MTEELFDLLRRKGLKDTESVESVIGARYTLSQLIELDRELAHVIEKASGAPTATPREVTGFDFWPNSDLAGSFGGCREPDCREERVETLSRFASMWADSLYIPSYFGVLPEGADEDYWRNWLLGSVRALLCAEPCIDAGVIRLAPRHFDVCPFCHPEANVQTSQLVPLLVQAERSMRESYRDRLKVSFQAIHGAAYILAVTGPEDLLPHGGWGIVTDASLAKPPEWLPKTVRKKAQAGEHLTYDVPRDRARKSGLVERVFHRISDDILNQHVACTVHGTKYLTHRPADRAFLGAINDNENFAAWNEVLAQHLQYEMPILSGVPLEDLIELRKKDYHAFLVYRDTLKSVIRDHVARRPAITGKEATEIYGDVVRPALNKMNQKLAAAKEKMSNRLHRDVLIASGLVALGLTTALVAPEVTALAAAAVGAKNILERRHASEELKSDNFYFLWKVAE
ncbi:unnamed protein product, partial [marine sediment metagenome]